MSHGKKGEIRKYHVRKAHYEKNDRENQNSATKKREKRDTRQVLIFNLEPLSSYEDMSCKIPVSTALTEFYPGPTTKKS
jgi:hypothetical protein